MATRGYNSYRGRMTPGKKVLIVVLVLILLGACGFLFCQEYLVYDDSGHVSLSLLKKEKPAEAVPEENTDSVELIREEPEAPTLSAITANELKNSVLDGDWASTLNALPKGNAVVLNAKLKDGSFIYQTAVTQATSAKKGSAGVTQALKNLLATDRYSVARISCFADTNYAAANATAAGLCRENGAIWYDGSGECWLDPAKQSARDYVSAVCKECAELGFKELMLDYYYYPATGNVSQISYGSGVTPADALSDFAKTLREELSSYDVAISIVLRQNVTETADASGLTVSLLADSFDRIYVDTGTVNMQTLSAALPTDFDKDTRLVPMVRSASAANTTSYMVIQ
ncbi:MAG: hypothetical protein GXW99_08880 [Clostridiales bacterium]|nr:hypothetical protein [Clostridiales bacterium]